MIHQNCAGFAPSAVAVNVVQYIRQALGLLFDHLENNSAKAGFVTNLEVVANTMKIQLASTLPFSPVLLDTRHPTPRRAVGQLQGVENGVEYSMPVYEFRHDEDVIHYQVDQSERVSVASAHALSGNAANDSVLNATNELVWIEHSDNVTYKPYAFVVMNAMTRLVGEWDGIVYRTPSGERLRESAFQATLQIVDACVSPQTGLWVMVNLVGEATGNSAMNSPAVRQMGWVPVAC